MITEDYVSFETAKLLKEKGFDGPCYKVWESHDDSQTLVGAPWFVEGETVVNRESVDAAAKQYAYEYNLNNKVEGYLAPTLQMAMKWLRDVHNIDIIIGKAGPKAYTALIIDNNDKDKSYHPFEDNIKRGTYCEFATYEQACESAIKYCLENLI